MGFETTGPITTIDRFQTRADDMVFTVDANDDSDQSIGNAHSFTVMADDRTAGTEIFKFSLASDITTLSTGAASGLTISAATTFSAAGTAVTVSNDLRCDSLGVGQAPTGVSGDIYAGTSSTSYMWYDDSAHKLKIVNGTTVYQMNNAGTAVGLETSNLTAIYFTTNGTGRWYVDATGELKTLADNAYDIGSVAVNRPRTAYIATSINVGNGITPSTANGDVVFGDGSTSLALDASAKTLTLAGGNPTQLIVDGSANLYWVADRGATTNDGVFLYRTAGVDDWAAGYLSTSGGLGANSDYWIFNQQGSWTKIFQLSDGTGAAKFYYWLNCGTTTSAVAQGDFSSGGGSSTWFHDDSAMTATLSGGTGTQLIVDSTGNLYWVADRGATTNDGAFLYRTAGTDDWAAGYLSMSGGLGANSDYWLFNKFGASWTKVFQIADGTGATTIHYWANVGTTTSAVARGDFSSGGGSSTWFHDDSAMTATFSGGNPTQLIVDGTHSVYWVADRGGTTRDGVFLYRTAGTDDWAAGYMSTSGGLGVNSDYWIYNKFGTTWTKVAQFVDNSGEVNLFYWLNVGTTVLATAQGDFAAGLTGACEMLLDVSAHKLTLNDNTGSNAEIVVDNAGAGRAVVAIDPATGQAMLDFRLAGTSKYQFFTTSGDLFCRYANGVNVDFMRVYDGATVRVDLKDYVNVGTATDAVAQGDFTAGLTGASRLFFDQSAARLTLYSGATDQFYVDGATGHIYFRTATSSLFRNGISGDYGSFGNLFMYRTNTVDHAFYTGATLGTMTVTGTRAMLIDATDSHIIIDKWLNVGTTVLATAQGDAAFGITGSGQLFFDESVASLYLYDSGGTVRYTIDTDNHQVTFESDSAGATGPIYRAYHNSASPAISDVVFRLQCDGEDSLGNTTTYGQWDVVIVDPTDASEASQMDFSVYQAGSIVTANLDTNGVWQNASSQRFKTYEPAPWNSALAVIRRLNTGVYRAAGDGACEGPQHIAPTAERWREVTGLRGSDSHLAPSDLAGLALMGVEQNDDRITTLERENARLRARVAALEAAA